MFDFYGGNHEALVNSMKVVSIELSAIAQILIDKNVVSEEEYLQYKNKFKQITEDIFAAEIKKQEDKFKQENPLVSKLFGLDTERFI